MARLNEPLESDDEFPKLSTLLGSQTDAIIRSSAKTSKHEHSKMPFQTTEIPNLVNEDFRTGRRTIAPTTVSQVSPDKPRSRKQRPLGQLKSAHITSLLLPVSDASISGSRNEDHQRIEPAVSVSKGSGPKRLGKSDFAQVSARSSIPIHQNDDSSTDLSGFIVPDSASDGDSLVSKSPKRKKSRTPKTIPPANPQTSAYRVFRQPDPFKRQPSGTADLIPPGQQGSGRLRLESPPMNESLRSESVETRPNIYDRLVFSTPRAWSPYEFENNYHPLTPPSSPSKSKLNSPSRRHGIPPSPHRPSIDAFWSQDVINNWNEKYPPRKIVESPRRIQNHTADEDERTPPSEIGGKSPVKSSAKNNKKVIEQRKLFDNKKHELATTFLAEVDQALTNGQVTLMALPTGGIHIIWSNKLSSTAGRANWRREAICSKKADGVVSNTHRHHASIELAEKVIDCEDRLMNVVAHEYCHLANFMISGIKDNPHGREFKEWARQCTNAFSHRAINVTTKHTYTIAYKYIWTCMTPTCGLEYQRHSKSIDPSRHSCGKCKGKLAQVQPAPRRGADEGKRSEYQDFVKRENRRVRCENPGAGFGEIMVILGREFRERKRSEAESASGVKEHGALENTGSNELEDLDSVVRQLDFLNLES